MALKGTINGSTSNTDIKSKIEWSATQSVTGNYSDISIKLYLRRVDSLTTYGYGSFAVKADSSSKSNSSYVSISSGWVTVASGTIRVNHASDGSKRVTISGSGSIPGTTLTSISCSSTVTLDTIPRASVPSGSGIDFGQTLSLKMNRKSSSFTHTVKITLGSYTKTNTGVGDSTSFAIPESWANACANANSTSISVFTTTYNGSTAIGTSTVKITVSVPSSWQPSFQTLTASSDNHLSDGQYLSTLSKVTLTASGGSASSGAIIKTWTFTGPSLSNTITSSSSSASSVSGVLQDIGSLSYKCTLTDSRGRKAEKSIVITSIAYAPPSIQVSTDRYNQSGAQDDVGAFFKANLKGSYSAVSGNKYTIRISVRENKEDPDDFVVKQTWADQTTTPFDLQSILIPASDTAAWQIRVEITDLAGSNVVVNTILPTGAVLIDFLKGGKGMALGRSSTGEGFYSHLGLFTDVLKHLDGTNWMEDAIVEADLPNSSTDWKVIKTQQGLAICWIKIVGTASITSTWGSIYTNPTKPYATFPFSFIAEPTVFMSSSSVTGLNGDYWLGKVNMAQTASRSGDIGLWRATSATGVNYGVYVLAIGRYK